MGRALILTYHAIEARPGPLCVAPELFRAHVDAIVASGARVVTISQLADALSAGTLDEPTVAITFDDGFASVADTAAPLLAERGLTATLFCVAGHLGGRNDWPSAHPGGFESQLADGTTLAQLAGAGFEIGSHGTRHEPLVHGDERLLRQEVVESQRMLEQVVGARVRTFAYPYGAGPSAAAARLVAKTYGAACTTVLRRVPDAPDLHSLPRVDVHYVRRPELLRRALAGSLDAYLRTRERGARVRRVLRKDYAATEPAPFGGESPPE